MQASRVVVVAVNSGKIVVEEEGGFVSGIGSRARARHCRAHGTQHHPRSYEAQGVVLPAQMHGSARSWRVAVEDVVEVASTAAGLGAGGPFLVPLQSSPAS